MSPRKKKPRTSKTTPTNSKKLKRESDFDDVACKRLKVIKNEADEIKIKKKKNFIEACKQVSCKAYFNHRVKLLLIYLPSCMKTSICKHHEKNATDIKQMPSYAVESFKIEMRNNMWYEALEVCVMCITPVQYLSADVLKDVVEIMLNAHEDDFSEYSLEIILEKCQQILAQNFSTHPPCFFKSLRKCYQDFLLGPMDLKEKTFSNRTEYECNKGIVKYCINRLEYEISANSLDGPLIDKYENIPEEMRDSVRGLHWQKEKFEIYELLNRTERIERLLAVLQSLIELLQFDLGIWHSRYTNNLGRHIMRSHKPLMAFVLWSDNVLYTGAVTNNCKQILRLFVHMIHLQYPDSMLRIITTWLNTMIQTFYICETNSNSDYPNTSKYCTVFANEFYKIFAGMPQSTIIRILEKVEPTFMRHLLGVLHIKKILTTDNDCIVSILTNFVKESEWESFPSDDSEIKFSPKLFPRANKINNKVKYFIKKCQNWIPEIEDTRNYAKLDPESLINDSDTTLNHVVQILYITLEAYLDVYNIQDVQETWNNLNAKMLDENVDETDNCNMLEQSSYTVSEDCIKKYRHLHQTIKQLGIAFYDLRSTGNMPEVLNIFRNIGSLEL